MLNHIKKVAENYYDQLVEYRHYLHQNPELSFQEFNTSAWIRKKLSDLGIPVMEGVSGNSVVGILDSKVSGPVIAFRADIDALPIQEENEISYKSKIPNVMHACGHDAHTATLLWVAMVDFLTLLCQVKKCTCHVNTSIGYPAVINSENTTKYVKQAIEKLGYHYITSLPIMGCEDFAYYLLKTPGTFINIGS